MSFPSNMHGNRPCDSSQPSTAPRFSAGSWLKWPSLHHPLPKLHTATPPCSLQLYSSLFKDRVSSPSPILLTRTSTEGPSSRPVIHPQEVPHYLSTRSTGECVPSHIPSPQSPIHHCHSLGKKCSVSHKYRIRIQGPLKTAEKSELK